MNRSVYFLKQELVSRGYSFHLFPESNLFFAKKNDVSFFSSSTKTQVQSGMGFWISEDKYLTKQVLEFNGLPTARGVKLTADSVERTQFLTFPIVMKPLNLSGGRDVSVGISSKDDVLSYIKKHPIYTHVLAEEMLVGEDVRILIVKGKFFAAVKRRPAFVIGNGIHTIEELVKIENKRRARIFSEDEKNQTYTTDLDLILFDSDAKSCIKEQSRTEASILPRGEQFFVRKNANTSTGGISVDVTDNVCLEIREQCEAVAKTIALTLAGIDIMTTDLSRPLSNDEKSGVVEVNASPGIYLHILTDEGQRRNPAPLIIDEIEEYFSHQQSSNFTEK